MRTVAIGDSLCAGYHQGKSFSIVYLPFLFLKGAFDEAVVGVCGIFHTACPGDFRAGISGLYISI
jgi:hypothetical protein